MLWDERQVLLAHVGAARDTMTLALAETTDRCLTGEFSPGGRERQAAVRGCRSRSPSSTHHHAGSRI